MAIVIHTRKGKYQYAYEHTREDDKVVSRYMYPIDAKGNQTKPYQKEVAQQIETGIDKKKNTEKIDTMLNNMNTTLEQKKEYWNNLQAKTQTKKIEHQYTKVSTDEQKLQKKKTQAYYESELKKIREIQDSIEHLFELERNSSMGSNFNETLEQKKEYWNNLQAKTQTKKIEHQYTKVSTDEQKLQKKKTQAYYESELKKIREIQDSVEHLSELERKF